MRDDNMCCSDCGKESTRLEGRGMDDFKNDKHYCRECLIKHHPEILDEEKRARERQQYNALVDSLMDSIR